MSRHSQHSYPPDYYDNRPSGSGSAGQAGSSRTGNTLTNDIYSATSSAVPSRLNHSPVGPSSSHVIVPSPNLDAVKATFTTVFGAIRMELSKCHLYVAP